VGEGLEASSLIEVYAYAYAYANLFD